MSANSPSTFSSVNNLVIGLFPRFNSRQNNSAKYKNECQTQSIIKASNSETLHNTNGNKGINVNTDTIQEADVSDLVDLSMDAVHHDASSISPRRPVSKQCAK